MSLKLIGAVCIILACGGMGYSMAAAHRREEIALRQLIGALDHMGCELQYRLTPLPELCRCAAEDATGCVGQVLQTLSDELASQVAPDATSCMRAAVEKVAKLPPSVRKALLMLGSSLGRYDLPGQIKGIEAVRIQCRTDLEALSENRDVRLRSYQTLGLCAGCALAILFL
jgi:stage III sporulation protein AB